MSFHFWLTGALDQAQMIHDLTNIDHLKQTCKIFTQTHKSWRPGALYLGADKPAQCVQQGFDGAVGHVIGFLFEQLFGKSLQEFVDIQKNSVQVEQLDLLWKELNHTPVTLQGIKWSKTYRREAWNVFLQHSDERFSNCRQSLSPSLLYFSSTLKLRGPRSLSLQLQSL